MANKNKDVKNESNLIYGHTLWKKQIGMKWKEYKVGLIRSEYANILMGIKILTT